jgi:hypothetical protein
MICKSKSLKIVTTSSTYVLEYPHTRYYTSGYNAICGLLGYEYVVLQAVINVSEEHNASPIFMVDVTTHTTTTNTFFTMKTSYLIMATTVHQLVL